MHADTGGGGAHNARASLRDAVHAERIAVAGADHASIGFAGSVDSESGVAGPHHAGVGYGDTVDSESTGLSAAVGAGTSETLSVNSTQNLRVAAFSAQCLEDFRFLRGSLYHLGESISSGWKGPRRYRTARTASEFAKWSQAL